MPGFAEMPPFDQTQDEDEVWMPSVALCLKMPPDAQGHEDLIVHREDREDFVFLFESLDDAYHYANAAQDALGFMPRIGRVQVDTLRFRMARYKPAVGNQIDIALRPS